MASLNRVELIGHLGGDPELSMTGKGNPKVIFRLATTYRWRDTDGQSREATDWHNIVVWNKLAEICARNLAKGRLVYVEGRLTTRQWEREGQLHYRTEVVAAEVQFLGDRRHWDVGVDEEVVSEEDD
jgi:single-strand DNA-binding protein